MSVYTKLAKAQALVAGVEKAGKNESQGYNFVRAVDVVKEGKKALLEAGLTVHLSVSPKGSEPFVIERGGKAPTLIYLVEGQLTVVDPETGEKFSLDVAGAGSSYGDEKGIYKAITGAWKYGIRGLLQIPDEKDDPEVDEKDASAVVAQELQRVATEVAKEDRKITPGQNKLLRAKAKEVGLSDDQLHAFILTLAGKNHVTDILMSEFNTVLEKLSDNDFVEMFATAKVG